VWGGTDIIGGRSGYPPLVDCGHNFIREKGNLVMSWENCGGGVKRVKSKGITFTHRPIWGKNHETLEACTDLYGKKTSYREGGGQED